MSIKLVQFSHKFQSNFNGPFTVQLSPSASTLYPISLAALPSTSYNHWVSITLSTVGEGVHYMANSGKCNPNESSELFPTLTAQPPKLSNGMERKYTIAQGPKEKRGRVAIVFGNRICHVVISRPPTDRINGFLREVFPYVCQVYFVHHLHRLADRSC